MRDLKIDPTVWGNIPAVALDLHVLRDLRDLAASSAEAARGRVYSPRSLATAAYAEGVTAVLDWLVTGTASTELAELLELEA